MCSSDLSKKPRARSANSGPRSEKLSRTRSRPCTQSKARGARVIGIAGGPGKCRYLLDTLGADVAIDYKNADIAQQLAKAAPDGVDVFFDNVGGETLDIVLDNLAPAGARVAICGAISQYQHLEDVRGPKLYLRLAERNAMMKGFVVSYYEADFGEAMAEIAGLMRAGKLVLPEHVVSGIEHLSSLPRGTGALGFYEEDAQRVPIASIRIASDLPAADQPRFEYLSTESPDFQRYANARANRRDAFYIQPAGGVDICNVPVPIRRRK